MQTILQKIGSFLAAALLAVSFCLFPYSQAAYAFVQAAIPAGYALASILAVLGVSVVINDDSDATALWSDFELYTGDLDAMAAGVSSLQDAAISNGNLVNVTKSQVSQQEVDAIKDVFSAAGEAGTFALDQLSMVGTNGALGLLPFILSLYIADQIKHSVGDSNIIDFGGIGQLRCSIMDVGKNVNLAATNDGLSYYLQPYIHFYLNGQLYGIFGRGVNTKTLFIGDNSGFMPAGGIWMVSDTVGISKFDGSQWLSVDSLVTDLTSAGIPVHQNGSQTFFDLVSLSAISDVIFPSPIGIDVNQFSGSGFITLGFKRLGSLTWEGSSVTTNPDVNLGHDWWTDAQEKGNADLLNPATGASVIGSDAVFDGDYITNRGSITIPTDWSNINSWADALGATHAGVAEGVLDGTISGTTTGTAVDVSTGELVNGTVSDLTKPGSNTSVSLPLPGLFDGVVDAVTDKFPFCIPGDLY